MQETVLTAANTVLLDVNRAATAVSEVLWHHSVTIVTKKEPPTVPDTGINEANRSWRSAHCWTLDSGRKRVRDTHLTENGIICNDCRGPVRCGANLVRVDPPTPPRSCDRCSSRSAWDSHHQPDSDDKPVLFLFSPSLRWFLAGKFFRPFGSRHRKTGSKLSPCARNGVQLSLASSLAASMWGLPAVAFRGIGWLGQGMMCWRLSQNCRGYFQRIICYEIDRTLCVSTGEKKTRRRFNALSCLFDVFESSPTRLHCVTSILP